MPLWSLNFNFNINRNEDIEDIRKIEQTDFLSIFGTKNTHELQYTELEVIKDHKETQNYDTRKRRIQFLGHVKGVDKRNK